MQLKNKHILILILLVAVSLRVYNLFNIPFTHDEFSALFRLYFDNVYDVIMYGARIDGHPAGIHVFLYYWTSWFGTEEWVVKLPFILFGIASVWLIYKISCFWKNETVGLVIASFLAVSQFTVMYSQIARPYISGLFFSLIMVFFWSKLMLKPERKFNLNISGFILGASLCTYNHHFSMLFAVILGVVGVFYINKKYLILEFLIILKMKLKSIIVFQMLGGNLLRVVMI
mgnify:CR=1 FL=1